MKLLVGGLMLSAGISGTLLWINRASAIDPGDGVVVYGEDIGMTPRNRLWSGSTHAFGTEQSGNAITDGVNYGIRHSVVKSSTTRNEMVAGYLTEGCTLNIQRWNGTSWSNEWNTVVGDPLAGCLSQRFDIAVEDTSGDVLVAYSKNVTVTNEIAYRRWNGTSWTSESTLDSTRTSGVVDRIRLKERTGTDQIGLVWADLNFDVSAQYWDGSTDTWIGEPSAALETNISVIGSAAYVSNASFDLAFESLSGDLMIIWGTNGVEDPNYIMRTAGPAGTWGTISTASALLEEPTDLEIAADPLSDYIAYANVTDIGNDGDRAVWDGSAWTAAGNFDTTLNSTDDSSKDVTVGWISSGSETRAVLLYDDYLAAGIDWTMYNKNNGLWTGLFDDPIALVADGTDDKLLKLVPNPYNYSELMLMHVDYTGKLLMKRLNMYGSLLTWTSAEPGAAALETTMTHPLSVDFAFTRLSPTMGQSSYRFFVNTNSITPGTPLAAENTSTNIAVNTPFRLRQRVAIDQIQLPNSIRTFKLQYKQKSGACVPNQSGYNDVSSVSEIAYYDNMLVASGASISSIANDPTNGVRTAVAQSYHESNPFTNNIASIASGQDGIWDMALTSTAEANGKTYCLRVVSTTGALLSTYASTPEIEIGVQIILPTLQEQLRGGSGVLEGVKAPYVL